MKYTKLFLAIAVLGIAVQTFADKPEAEEPSFSNDWNKMQTSLAALNETE